MWDVESGLFYWADGTGRRKGKDIVFRIQPRSGKAEKRAIQDHDVGAIAMRENGGLDDLEALAICGLWRLYVDLSVSRIGGDIICTNGPCFSPGDKTFYATDTFQEEIWAHDYDFETGAVSNRRAFASANGGLGICGIPEPRFGG